MTDVSIESGVLLTLNKVPIEKKRNEESLELDLDEAAVADLLRPPEAMDEARKPPIGSVQSSPAFKLRPKLKLDLSPLKINTSTVSSGSRNSDGARKNPYLAANKLMLQRKLQQRAVKQLARRTMATPTLPKRKAFDYQGATPGAEAHGRSALLPNATTKAGSQSQTAEACEEDVETPKINGRHLRNMSSQ